MELRLCVMVLCILSLIYFSFSLKSWWVVFFWTIIYQKHPKVESWWSLLDEWNVTWIVENLHWRSRKDVQMFNSWCWSRNLKLLQPHWRFELWENSFCLWGTLDIFHKVCKSHNIPLEMCSSGSFLVSALWLAGLGPQMFSPWGEMTNIFGLNGSTGLFQWTNVKTEQLQGSSGRVGFQSSDLMETNDGVVSPSPFIQLENQHYHSGKVMHDGNLVPFCCCIEISGLLELSFTFNICSFWATNSN